MSMQAEELKKYIDKPVLHFDRRYHEKSIFLLKAVKLDKSRGVPYAVLKDREHDSYMRARVEDIGVVSE